jgi:hypothetical protein
MESLMKPVALNQDVSKVLDEIRAGAENALYGAGPDESEELFAKHVVSLVEGAGLPVLQAMHYRWFLRELARLWRTRRGRDLAFHLELCIRKWVGLGLEPRTLQFLVCESYERLKAANPERSRPPITPITEDSSSSVRNHDLPESVESVDSPPTPSSAEAADVQARISHPPITPITEDSSSSVRNHNLPESVESVDVLSATGTLPGCMAGPRPPARGTEDSATKAPRGTGFLPSP